MADIAAVFHWPPSAFADMRLGELVRWHALAVDRFALIRGLPHVV